MMDTDSSGASTCSKRGLRDRPTAYRAILPVLCRDPFLGLTEVKPQWFGVASKVALATKRYAPSTPLGEHTKRDGLDLRRLKREKMTVYLLVPSSMLSVALPWLNLLVGLFSQAIGRPGPAQPVTMLIDEAPALGFLPDLRTAMAQHRKAGLRVWLFTQTYSALLSLIHI